MKTKMKIYPKNKFWSLNDDNSYKEPLEDELYVNKEFRFISKFPFIKKLFVAYILKGNVWVEYDLDDLSENNLDENQLNENIINNVPYGEHVDNCVENNVPYSEDDKNK
jgi:hypothetical protein